MAHQLTLNSTMLEELKAKAAALPDEKKIQESKSVTPDTNQQTVTPDGGYDGLAEVTVNAIPTGSVGNPTIDVNSSGVITATAAVDAGYVDGTDKTGTKQLTIQAAKTITPTKSSQTAVESGRYTTGAVIVAAIPNKYEDRTESLPQLNTVNGGTAASTMAEAVDNTEALMDDENILITQLQTKLEGMTYDSSNLQKKVIQPMVYDQIITADGAYQALSQVTVRGDSNLTATNIAKDVTIFGVTGTHEGGEDISAETAEYTELLADLETTIDAMSDAGGGGGSGGSVETCTVTINFTGTAAGYGESGECDIYYANGTEAVTITATSDSTVIDVLKGSLLVMTLDAYLSALGTCVTDTVSLILDRAFVSIFYVPDSGTITIG